MGKSKDKAVESSIGLKEVREYYGKSTGILSFMNLIFMLVISGLGIYMADIMSSAGEEHETKVLLLYTVFVVGAVLSLLMIIGCIMGRKGEYEAALKFRRVLSVIAFVLGIISFFVSASAILETYEEWEDAYTATIFILQLLGSILTIVYSVMIFLLGLKGGRYYDSKSVAKDIPENMTVEKNSRRYMFFVGLSYFIISISTAFLAFYFANEIDSYSVRDLSDNGTYSGIYEIIFICGVVTSILVLAVSVAVLIFKNEKFYILSRMSYLVSAISQLAFVIYSLVMIPKDFVTAKSPDITYIIFGVILVAVSYIFAMKSYSIAKKSSQM